MEHFALIFASLIIGFIMRNSRVFPKDMPLILNQFVLYISLPAMALKEIPKLTLSSEIIIPISIAWGVMMLSALAIWLLSYFFKFSKEVVGSLLLVGVLGNTSFVGIPLIEAYLGNEALGYILIYDQLGSFIALSTYGTFISIYYTTTSSVDVKAIAKKIALFPPFLALMVALLFIGNPFPSTIDALLGAFSSTITPLALVAVGMGLRFSLPREDIKPFSVAIFTTLVLSPLFAIVLCAMFGWDTLASKVSIMEASMGPMVSAGVVASISGLAPRLSSSIVGYGILLSFMSSWVIFRLI